MTYADPKQHPAYRPGVKAPNTARQLWVIWCIVWVLIWFVIGILVWPCLLLSLASIGALFIPVGKSPHTPPGPPPYYAPPPGIHPPPPYYPPAAQAPVIPSEPAEAESA
jgi:hypothetical protein